MDKYLLDLPMEDGRKFHFRSEPLKGIYDELEEFLECTEGMDDLHFAKKMLFSHELKANNQVEGYSDDLELIEDIMKKKTDNIQDRCLLSRMASRTNNATNAIVPTNMLVMILLYSLLLAVSILSTWYFAFIVLICRI